MEREHRDILRENFVTLRSELEARKTANSLFSCGIFDAEDRNRVLAEKIPEYQAEMLMDLLPQKGPRAFHVFCEILQSIAPHLGNLIRPRKAGFPSLEELNLQAASLPGKVDIFVGRTELCEEIVKLQAENWKLILIVAPPFNGKSATATMAGHMLQQEGLQVLHFPLNGATCLTDAAVVILNTLRQIVGTDPISQLKQLLHSLDKRTVIILDNTEDLQAEGKEDIFLDFLKNIGQYAKHVCTIITTRKAVHNIGALFPFRAVSIPLKPLDENASVSLLQQLAPSLPLPQARRLNKCCMGVPFLLHFISSLVKMGDRVETLIRELETNPEVLLQGNSSSLEDYFCYLKLFVSHLPKELRETLARLAVFPASFTSEKARFLFPEKTSELNYFSWLTSLQDYSLLSLDTEKATYELHPQVQTFLRTQADDFVLSESYEMGKRLFIQHNLNLLRDFHAQFISKENKIAMDRYGQNKRDIDHALRLAADDVYLRHFGIEVSTEVVNLLAKVLNIKEFETIYYAFERSAYSLHDLRMQSDCLTSIGFKLVCYHGNTNSAAALDVLTKARDLQSLQEERDTEECAHCLSKRGLCLARLGETEHGMCMIEQGIAMRERLVRAFDGPAQRMLVGGGYCDLAMALSTSGNDQDAIRIWQTYCLDIYTHILGNHPFTATLLQYIGDAYHRLGSYDEALNYKRKSLDMRKNVLGLRHPDTARSCFCLAETLTAFGKHDEAMDMLKCTLEIQARVLASQGDVKVTVNEMRRVEEIRQARGEICNKMRACNLGNRGEPSCEDGRIPSL